MSRTDPMLRIRLPQPLKEWIEAEARRNCRSQNGEIVFRLEAGRLQVERPGEAVTATEFNGERSTV